MSVTARGHLAISVKAAFIAYGAPAIAILSYLTFWPAYLQTVFHLQLPISLNGPLWTDTFNDLDAVLRALACARQGVDVTLPNACMGGGLFQYSPLLLTAAALPIGPALRVPLGLGLDVLFLLSLFTLPRPRRWREFWCLLLAALSGSTYWALESANIDVALYLLVLLAVHLLLRGTGMRIAGYTALMIAAAIKFYPACLLVLAARERTRQVVPMALGSLGAALLLAVAFAGQLGHIVPRLPHGSPFGAMFAVTNLPDGIAMMLAGDVPDHALNAAIRAAAILGLLLMCARIVWTCVPTLLPELRTMAPRERMLLLAGTVSMTFCFLAAQNFLYRQIFLILTLPGFWDLERRASDPAHRARFRVASWGAVGLMWLYFFQFLSFEKAGFQPVLPVFVGMWLVREVLWWWLTGLFAAIILCFLWDAPVLAHWRVRAPSAAC